VKTSRKSFAAKKSSKKLLYEERFPDYILHPDIRRNAYRWYLRQKLIYSHPDYN
jgi:hypothetical protein